MNRIEILEAAIRYVSVDRAATHGGAEDSFDRIADFWSTYLSLDLNKQDVCAMMVLLKVARIAGNPKHVDSWIDCAGYASLGGEMRND